MFIQRSSLIIFFYTFVSILGMGKIYFKTWIVYSSKINVLDMICEDGLSKRKVVMHAGNVFKFQELSDFNEVKCKAAYKVFIISTSTQIIDENN